MNDISIDVLLVEDNLGDAFLIKNLLSVNNVLQFKLTHVENLAEAITYSREQSFDLALLDLWVPDSQGIETLLTMIEQTTISAILILTAIEDEELAIQAVKQGAQDYLVKSQVNRELLTRSIRYAIERANLLEKLRQKEKHLNKSNQELAQQNKKLKYLLNIATKDRLTNLANRYSFEELLEREWKYAVRNSTPFSVIMIDIDYFKLFNDTYGHLQGDDCLRKVAQVIEKELKRPKDLAVRYGGEEFLAILPDTDREGAIFMAEKIQNKVRALRIAHPKSKISDRLTVSLGVATLIPLKEMNPKDLINYADRALYLAKHKGRDRFEIYDNLEHRLYNRLNSNSSL